MLKYLSICAALVVIGTAPVNAQQQEAVLQKLEVPGADFDFIVAMAKSQAGATIDLRGQPDPYIVYPIGDELAFAVDGEVEKMFKDIGSLRIPSCAFHVERQGNKPSKAVAVYVVPKDQTVASSKQ